MRTGEPPGETSRDSGLGTRDSGDRMRNGSSQDLAPSGTHEEIEDHSEDREKDDQQRPEDLGSGIRAALQQGNQGDNVQDQDDDADEREHLTLLSSPES